LSVAGGADFGYIGIGTSTPTNTLTVNGSANFTEDVGIGTNNPLSKLDVRGNSLFTGSMHVHENSQSDVFHVVPYAYFADTVSLGLNFPDIPKQRLSVNGSISQKVFTEGIVISANGTWNFIWNHNFGYQPVIVITKDQTGGQNMDYVEASYAHIDNNSLKIYLTNRSEYYAQGWVKWIVVY
jgi:hypothetical protein